MRHFVFLFLCDTMITRLFFFIYEAEGTDPAFQSDGKRRDMHQKIVYQSVFENSFLQLHAPQTVTHILQKAIFKHALVELCGCFLNCSFRKIFLREYSSSFVWMYLVVFIVDVIGTIK